MSPVTRECSDGNGIVTGQHRYSADGKQRVLVVHVSSHEVQAFYYRPHPMGDGDGPMWVRTRSGWSDRNTFARRFPLLEEVSRG